jgi:hypothetical protein
MTEVEEAAGLFVTIGFSGRMEIGAGGIVATS